jgi:hypothetical protein
VTTPGDFEVSLSAKHRRLLKINSYRTISKFIFLNLKLIKKVTRSDTHILCIHTVQLTTDNS